MFAQYFHHAPVMRNMIIKGYGWFHETAVFHREHIPQTVRVCLIRTEEAEIFLLGISREDISHHFPKLPGSLVALCGRLLDRNCIFCKEWEIKVDQEFA